MRGKAEFKTMEFSQDGVCKNAVSDGVITSDLNNAFHSEIECKNAKNIAALVGGGLVTGGVGYGIGSRNNKKAVEEAHKRGAIRGTLAVQDKLLGTNDIKRFDNEVMVHKLKEPKKK